MTRAVTPTSLSGVPLDPADVKLLARLGKKVEDNTRERNDAIRRIHAAGGGVREIARAVGLNHATVLNIIKPRQR